VELGHRAPHRGGREAVQAGRDATAVIWKTLLIAERTFRQLDAPELLAEVAEGVAYLNGERVKPSPSAAVKRAAA
jgi:hypothetical protein